VAVGAEPVDADNGLKDGVTIRRRPPRGITSGGLLRCGPDMSFHVSDYEKEDSDNKPKNILEEIVWYKAEEVSRYREARPLALVSQLARAADKLMPSRDFIGAVRAMRDARGLPGLIAEVKKASPSKGVIQPNFDPARIARSYEAGGAASLSVLTDVKFFQGSFDNLKLIREAGVTCPLLCKEFIVDAYQLMYARAHGADAVLLIAAVLPNADLLYLTKAARALNLQVLIEVHTVREMERVVDEVLDSVPGDTLTNKGVLLGINNRSLETFEVDLQNTGDILSSDVGKRVLAQGDMVVGESGIFTLADLKRMKEYGAGAVLVGESLVKQTDAAEGIRVLYEGK